MSDQIKTPKRLRTSSDDNANDSQFCGFGKLILFGEHFVVYQQPALVGAVAAYTNCRVKLSPEGVWSRGLIVEDERAAVPGYKDTKAEEMLQSTQLVLKHFGIDTERRAVHVHLGGPLCCVSGIGASAANCVALARALAAALGKTLSEEEINAAGYEGEKGYHGTPSGIDNTASTYGGVLRFQRQAQGAPAFETRQLAQPIRIVYASTGITASTTTVVQEIRDRRAAEPEWYAALETRYQALFERAETALAAVDAKAIGELANENHTLLQELGVSCTELDTLVEAARKAGALGAKLSGTGRGGLMWAIVADEASQDAVYTALSAIAPQVWKTEFK